MILKLLDVLVFKRKLVENHLVTFFNTSKRAPISIKPYTCTRVYISKIENVLNESKHLYNYCLINKWSLFICYYNYNKLETRPRNDGLFLKVAIFRGNYNCHHFFSFYDIISFSDPETHWRMFNISFNHWRINNNNNNSTTNSPTTHCRRLQVKKSLISEKNHIQSVMLL